MGFRGIDVIGEGTISLVILYNSDATFSTYQEKILMVGLMTNEEIMVQYT